MARIRILLPLLLLWMALGYGCQAQQDPNKPASVGTTASPAPAAATVEVVNVDAATKLIASDANLQILDVRTPEEVAAGVIAGAKIANWFDADFAQKATSSLDKGKPVLVYCKAGSRSSKAANVLLENGFSKVYNLEGGITAWNGAGKPLQK